MTSNTFSPNGDSSGSSNPDSAQSTQTNQPVGQGDTGDVQYRCSHCEATYENEILLRVHITRADDNAHKNWNGMMPETTVEVVNNSGSVIETISRRPKEIDLSELTVGEFPNDRPDHHQHILYVAAQNPEVGNYKTIEELVHSHLDQHAADVPVPSYSTIRRVIQDFFQTGSRERTSDPNSLEDLTAIQQAIIIARLILPEDANSHKQIAERVGCANSYPPQVCDSYAHILDELNVEAGDNADQVEQITDQLPEEDVAGLVRGNLVEALPIDLEQQLDDDESETGGWASPVANPTSIRAVPDHPADADGSTGPDAATESATAQVEESNGPGTNGEVTNAEQKAVQTSSEDQIKQGLKQLKSNVSFIKDTFQQGDQSSDSHHIVASFASQIEQRCEAIIEADE